MISKPLTIKFSKHWGSWAKGYLNLAEIGLRDFKNKESLGRTTPFPNSPKMFNLEQGSTLIACIWNIKHGLELTIKGLGVNIDKKFWGKHDVAFLLNDLESKLKDLAISKHVDILKNLADKYYNCRFTSKTVYLDRENTSFKYPETKDGYSLDYSFVHDVTHKDINSFLKDIHNLKRVYDILEGQPAIFQQGRDWKVPKKVIEKQLLSVPTMKNPGFKK